MMSATFGSGHERTRKAVAKLIALYDVWIEPERAAAWRSTLDESED